MIKNNKGTYVPKRFFPRIIFFAYTIDHPSIQEALFASQTDFMFHSQRLISNFRSTHSLLKEFCLLKYASCKLLHSGSVVHCSINCAKSGLCTCSEAFLDTRKEVHMLKEIKKTSIRSTQIWFENRSHIRGYKKH